MRAAHQDHHQAPLPIWKKQETQQENKTITRRDAIQKWRKSTGKLLLTKAEIRSNRKENPYDKQDLLKSQIKDLKEQVQEYEALLKELPDIFERKFQQRLIPLLERYRLITHTQNSAIHTESIMLEEPHPLRVPSLLRSRWLGGRGQSQQEN
ncbi:hypothetical protein PMIT1313_02539 [Prochlorococcus marinus str. MIT 1313]|uniref:hypothetical protein n=1 Tax=Prochlorococcus TaxID=1218 RepID=UPI0007B3A9D3|nr:hypothetical protein [Prochlorococcus marinus]KZR68914.1 hypothetical protein PMIT1313_02539 [Prochlorococcus marinus str. MIT 1313]KZR70847.1 hypothetical protein PMIT1318_01988 [Prochlorococcus marinus str. MIT 1318]